MSEQEYPSAIATVDVIPYCYSRETKCYEILLGRKKKHGDKLCFIGGFVDSEKDDTFCDAAYREMGEEVPSLIPVVSAVSLKYLYSTKVDDPRYKDRRSKIFTSIYLLSTEKMSHTAGDDLDEVVWRDLDMLVWNPDLLVPEHAKLIEDLSREIKWRLADFS
jgi:ADP-ribose pyrophosphatase YjhB (NUDIX family)